MFHVNKGVIAFKMDAARFVMLQNTSVHNVSNLGSMGSRDCGDYGDGFSHPKATLAGYGGARTRGYSFSGSHYVLLGNSHISGLTAAYGSAIGVDIFTDAKHFTAHRVNINDVEAGVHDPDVFYDGPNALPQAIGFHVGDATASVLLSQICAESLNGIGGEGIVDDWSGAAWVRGGCN